MYSQSLEKRNAYFFQWNYSTKYSPNKLAIQASVAVTFPTTLLAFFVVFESCSSDETDASTTCWTSVDELISQ